MTKLLDHCPKCGFKTGQIWVNEFFCPACMRYIPFDYDEVKELNDTKS